MARNTTVMDHLTAAHKHLAHQVSIEAKRDIKPARKKVAHKENLRLLKKLLDRLSCFAAES
jgi:hypothetical protein